MNRLYVSSVGLGGRCALLLILVAALVGVASANDYYVAPHGNDNSVGSAAKPWQTIAYAALQVRSGDTVHVISGTYRIQSSIVTKASGSAEARIRFISEEKWGAKIISTIGMPSSTWRNNGDFVDIVGFDITGDGNEGIDNFGSHVRIMGNHVHDYPKSFCELPSPTAAGINSGHNYNGGNNEVVGNVVHDIGTPKACNVGHGIYHANASGTISNNITYRNTAYGITAWHAATKMVIEHNLIFGNGLGGIWIGSARNLGVINQHSVIADNIIYDNGGWAIREAGRVGPNRYVNNVVFKNDHSDELLLLGNVDSGTIRADPEFVSYQRDGSGNYQLKQSSPARGHGPRDIPPPSNRSSSRPDR